MIFMKHFIYFSKEGTTSGKVISQGNLMKAGRIDIAIHSFIQAIYLSNKFRKDVTFHFLLYGMPDPPKHIEITVTDESQISKKDIANLIKKLLYKYKEGEKKEVVPGCFIEKKSLQKVIDELIENKTEIFILDKKGESIRKIKIPKNCAFILGDQDGIPKKELKHLKKILTPVSIGPHIYFASQTVAVVNNELDFREI
jgi:tRNA (pseudouridine54-N1)-methyltransferase